ncbi:pimeloyl-[acyl-carrier protein] methyl ester esterase [Modicisalibacter ilicicola DSM 19980]|uniref:Pimeloyl-[acyl-carrier protein] methyl ester esterase n=1 Tax=Modicisalibacter ilicicola DSM 19980 TaxID=1121942 RepID=A0A1M4WA18_9GAMM|nr:alpha/beta fold hydrolase [Halomonas ilicicola]SHE78015.1 pimeloyl-[acyl-carrier protein] methyl ester esterase [Halomonas ilicicola DSM 19980]
MSGLVLLSGWGIDARIWQPLTPYWPAGFSFHMPDWPGYAGRAVLPDPQDTSALANAMAAALPSGSVWVGWSLGALLAVRLLDHLPAPRAIVMLGMGSRLCTPGGVTPAALKAFRRAFAHDALGAWRHFLDWQLEGEPDPPHARQRLSALIGPRPSAAPATLAAGLDLLDRLNVSDRLAAPPCPILRLAGEQDPLLSDADLAAAEIRLPLAGHCPQISQPEALAEQLVALGSRSAAS